MAVRYVIQVDSSQIGLAFKRFFLWRSGLKHRAWVASTLIADNLLNQVRDRTPVGKTRHLANSWVVEPGMTEIGARIYNTARYAEFVFQGTGIHGPEKRMIETGRPMSFVSDRYNRKIVIWTSQGQKPKNPAEHVDYEQANKIFDEEMGKYAKEI